MLDQKININGKVGIVTGGSNGIGKALIELMVSKGMKVVFGDVDVENGDKLQMELNKSGNKVKFVYCNVSKESDLINLFETAKSEFGGAQVMVNNAGVSLYEKFEESTDGIDSIIDINLKSVLKGTSLAIQHFRHQNHLDYSIVNTASIVGIIPMHLLPIYSSSKAAIIHMTRSLKYLEDQNIRVNAVAPGASDTAIFSKNQPHPKIAELYENSELIPSQTIAKAILDFIETPSFFGDVMAIYPGKIELLPKAEVY